MPEEDLSLSYELMTTDQDDFFNSMTAEELQFLGYGTGPYQPSQYDDGSMMVDSYPPDDGAASVPYNEELDPDSALAQQFGEVFYQSFQQPPPQ
ncbi:hypothetical protein L198_08174 [Cryptococcus wingfieldii CBS 7118]|uniref:Uncharacterized protein n=1 Tax=Cryptococcus wingfieldii CBS 7118 TaxID=1295528 RepID=A0A1E3HF69_9TREE|nr:hypothetical protein L198_08174 [Cryptococcus wingfieldii CBS 7118]ODN74988.1 hypothetical protein L198_08174 [Cryptococcus wingfieldii CBS 7118]